MWLVAAVRASTMVEHFHYCRKFYWTALDLETAIMGLIYVHK